MLGNIPEDSTNYDFEQIPEFVNLSGVTFEGRQDIIVHLTQGTSIKLVRDPFNEHDRFAIKVFTRHNRSIVQIGWIPKKLAAVLAPEIDAGINWTGKIERVIGLEHETRGILVKLFMA